MHNFRVASCQESISNINIPLSNHNYVVYRQDPSITVTRTLVGDVGVLLPISVSGPSILLALFFDDFFAPLLRRACGSMCPQRLFVQRLKLSYNHTPDLLLQSTGTLSQPVAGKDSKDSTCSCLWDSEFKGNSFQLTRVLCVLVHTNIASRHYLQLSHSRRQFPWLCPSRPHPRQEILW